MVINVMLFAVKADGIPEPGCDPGGRDAPAGGAAAARAAVRAAGRLARARPAPPARRHRARAPRHAAAARR